MKWKILPTGKPALAYAKSGVEEYLKRLSRYATVELNPVREGRAHEVAAALWRQSEGGVRVLLDERGALWSTEELRRQVDAWEMDRVRQVSWLIGPADGHRSEDREQADAVVALSRFTLQHELALVLLLEQIYRVYTMKRGEPYHR